MSLRFGGVVECCSSRRRSHTEAVLSRENEELFDRVEAAEAGLSGRGAAMLIHFSAMTCDQVQHRMK